MARTKARAKTAIEAMVEAKATSKTKGSGKLENDKECYLCGKKDHVARDCWSRANHDKMVNEFEVENVNAEPGKEFVFTFESEINDVNLSQDGCAEREDGLVMIHSGASAEPLSTCVPRGLGTPNWNSLMVRLVSDVPTENRSRNSDRSG